MSFHRENSCLQGSEPSTSFPVTKNKKDKLPLSLLHWPLLRHKPLSLSRSIFWHTHPEHRLPLSLFTSCPSTPQTPLSLSLSQSIFLTNPSWAAKKIIPTKHNCCEKPVMILFLIFFKHHSVYVLEHPVPLSNVRFQLSKKTKRCFVVFYVKFIGKGVFIDLVHTESACSTTSIL